MAVKPLVRLTFVPNPTHGSTTLSFASTDRPAQVALLDASGRTLDVQRISAMGSVTMDLSAHGKGLYFVDVLFADGTRMMERVVKE
jgi:Secretion system C-terminal sorting domain